MSRVGEAGVTLRIVVHGASGAGKTTTARALGERLGQPVAAAEEVDGRTLWFDWMEYVGGRHEGQPIHTQFVTVPGHLPDRALRLVETADVVLFVIDSTRDGIDASVAAWEAFRAASAAAGPAVVFQVNKRDDPTALPVAEVRRRFGIGAEATLIETSALDGDGVRQAFVYTVRAGLNALGGDGGGPVGPRHETAAELEAYLRTEALVDNSPKTPDNVETMRRLDPPDLTDRPVPPTLVPVAVAVPTETTAPVGPVPPPPPLEWADPAIWTQDPTPAPRRERTDGPPMAGPPVDGSPSEGPLDEDTGGGTGWWSRVRRGRGR